MKVYISGPVTGNKDYKEQFGSMSYLLKREGHGAVNPVQIMEPVRGVLDYQPRRKTPGFSYGDIRRQR